MIVDISNEVFTKLKNDLVGVKVIKSTGDTPIEYPTVTFSELSNVDLDETRDSSGTFHNELRFEVNIFTDGSNRETSAKNIRNLVDDVLSGYYNMGRDFSDAVPNFLSQAVYRYTMRYSCLVDKNKVIYRR